MVLRPCFLLAKAASSPVNCHYRQGVPDKHKPDFEPAATKRLNFQQRQKLASEIAYKSRGRCGLLSVKTTISGVLVYFLQDHHPSEYSFHIPDSTLGALCTTNNVRMLRTLTWTSLACLASARPPWVAWRERTTDRVKHSSLSINQFNTNHYSPTNAIQTENTWCKTTHTGDGATPRSSHTVYWSTVNVSTIHCIYCTCFFFNLGLAPSASTWTVVQFFWFARSAVLDGFVYKIYCNPMHSRLVYFNGTDAKVRLLENVCTGQIGTITENQMGIEHHVRSIVVQPSVACHHHSKF